MSGEQITATEAVTRVVAQLGVPRRDQTVDEFLAGEPATVVRGIATTMMASMDVLRRCVAVGANLVISHEPVFWDHRNELIAALEAENDPVYRAKLSFIEENHLVIWHLHDALHDRRPDLIDLALIRHLGWAIPQGLTYPAVLDIPQVSLDWLAASLAERLGTAAARYIGDPDLAVSRVGLALGFRGADTIRHLLQDGVDAVIAGEAHEWEAGAYAADASALGFGKALIILGHIPSEQLAMVTVASLCCQVMPDLPVTFVPCPDLFHRDATGNAPSDRSNHRISDDGPLSPVALPQPGAQAI